jgi:hypothetical protein
MTAENRFCDTCGNPLIPGVRFCESCGKPVAGSLASPQEPAPVPAPPTPVIPAAVPRPVSPPRKRSNLGIALLVFVLILAIGGGAIWWFLWPKTPGTLGGPPLISISTSPGPSSPTPKPTPSFSPTPSPSPSPTPSSTPPSIPVTTPASPYTPTTPSATQSPIVVPTPSTASTPTASPSSSPTTTPTPVAVSAHQAESMVLEFLDHLRNGRFFVAGQMVTEHFKSLEPYYFSVSADFYAGLQFEVTRTEKEGNSVWVFTQETFQGQPGTYRYHLVPGPGVWLIDEVQPVE